MIKNMNSKMTTNSQPLTTQRKKQKQKLSKQLEQEQNTEMETTLKVISRESERREWGKSYRE